MKYLAVHFFDSKLSDNETLIDKNVVLVNDDTIAQLDEFEAGCSIAVLEKVHFLTVDNPVIVHEHIPNVASFKIKNGKKRIKEYFIKEENGTESSFPILGEIKFYKDK